MKTKSIKQIFQLALAVLLLSISLPASGHGLATTQAQKVGPYTIEFEYNSAGNARAGDYTLFLVYLLEGETLNGVDYDFASVRIEKENGPAALSGSLKGSGEGLGFSSISGILPEAGIYRASVNFYQDGKSLASANFNFQVDEKKSGAQPWAWPAIGFALLIIGFAIGHFVKFGGKSKLK